jgi:hypothetical protein
VGCGGPELGLLEGPGGSGVTGEGEHGSGALVDLVRDLITGKADVHGAADRLRSWQI